MLTRRFAVQLNRSLVGLLGIVIEKTAVAYLRSFPCVIVKKTFQVTCGDPETEVDLMILQFAPLIDQISVPVLGGFVVPVVDVECLNGKGRAKSIPKAYWGVGKQCTTDSTQDVWKIYITWLLTTLCKITRPVRLRPRLGIGQ